MRPVLLSHFLENSASRLPDKTALLCGGERYTYSKMEEMANAVANCLIKNRILCGDRVAVFMDSSAESVASIFGVLKAGAAFMPLNHFIKKDKLEFILNNSRASAIITQTERAHLLEEVNCPHLKTVLVSGGGEFAFDYLSFEEALNGSNSVPNRNCIDMDLASIIYTSGSTGVPKGVMLSHLNMVSAANSITSYLENKEDDVILNALPLSFDYGLYQVLMAFLFGGTVILERSFSYPYEALRIMERERVTGFPGVPTMFALLLRLKDLSRFDLRHLRYITNTGAALPAVFIEKLASAFPDARIYSMYGLTECKRALYMPPHKLLEKPLSVGKPIPNTEALIVDDEGNEVPRGETGELVVRGSNVMLGYWEMPEESARCLRPGRYPGERMLYTGDLFRMDEEGYFYFIARKDNILKCRGEKVSPREIENAISRLDGVAEVVVVGVPDELTGEAVKAFIVLHDEAGLTKKDLLRLCAERLEPLFVPKHIEIMPSLPKTSTGKIDLCSLKS